MKAVCLYYVALCDCNTNNDDIICSFSSTTLLTETKSPYRHLKYSSSWKECTVRIMGNAGSSNEIEYSQSLFDGYLPPGPNPGD